MTASAHQGGNEAASVTFHEVEPMVSVAILAVRNADLLARSLASLAATVEHEPAFEVILVLNAATEDVKRLARERVHGARVLESPVNLGTGGGFNRAFAASRGRFLAIAHDDSEVTPGWLSSLVATADSNPDAGAVGGRVLGFDGRLHNMGRIIWADGQTSQEWVGDRPEPDVVDRVRAVDYHGGLGLLIDRSAWESVGGFDDVSYYPAYHPDADLGIRLSEAGWRILYEPQSVVLHHGRSSSESRFQRFLDGRNTSRFRSLHHVALAAHGRPDPADTEAVEREVRRAAARAPGPRPSASVPGADALLAERLGRPDATYLALERDVWREFGMAMIKAEADTERRSRELAEALELTQADRDGWRATAAMLEERSRDLGQRCSSLEEQSRLLDVVLGSRWWKLGERLRRLRR